jgi:hypothetical protein
LETINFAAFSPFRFSGRSQSGTFQTVIQKSTDGVKFEWKMALFIPSKGWVEPRPEPELRARDFTE